MSLQPSARPEAGCDVGAGIMASVACFNPQPAQRRAATTARLTLSIGGPCFNPQPAQRRAATDARLTGYSIRRSMASTLSPPRGGLRLRHVTDCVADPSFNPQPAQRRAATTRDPGVTATLSVLQPSARPEAGCDARRHKSQTAQTRAICRVASTLSPPRGGLRPARHSPPWVWLQPSARPEAGCDRGPPTCS